MIHNDHLGTPQKMTDSSGTVVWAADYKPFGEATVTVSTITNNLRFPGQYYDAETGLSQNGFRDYNFATDRYIEADNVGIKQGKNHLYVYATNNPLRYSDPFGLYPGPCGNENHTWVPDHPYFVFNFTAACQAHDDCYGCPGARAGKTKKQCDRNFLSDMSSHCNNFIFFPQAYISCMNAAFTYFYAVSAGGDDAFQNARRNCCQR